MLQSLKTQRATQTQSLKHRKRNGCCRRATSTRSLATAPASKFQEKPVQPAPREPEEEVAPDGDINGAQQPRQALSEEESVMLSLEKAPFELLSERRKARLLELERSSGAKFTLDSARQAVHINGRASQVAEARQLIEDLCVEWVQVAEPVWAVLLRSRDRATGHLSVLQALTPQCSVVVDRSSSRVRVAGTAQQVECAQAWLCRMHEDCDTAEVWLGPHVKSPDLLATEAEANSLEVHVEVQRQRGGCVARVQGTTWEVQRVAGVLRAAASQSPSRTGSTAGTPCRLELSDKSGRSSKSTSSSGGRRSREPPLEVRDDWQQYETFETPKRGNLKRTTLLQGQQRREQQQQQQQERPRRYLPPPPLGRAPRVPWIDCEDDSDFVEELCSQQHELRREPPDWELRESDSSEQESLQPTVSWQADAAGPLADEFRQHCETYETPKRVNPKRTTLRQGQQLREQQQQQERPKRYLPPPPLECAPQIPQIECEADRGFAKGSNSNSLAKLLAQRFPTARIIVGAPDEQQKIASQAEASVAGEERLDTKMRQLKELLERDKARPLFP